MASITSVWVATAATRLSAFPNSWDHASHSRRGNPLGPSPFPDQMRLLIGCLFRVGSLLLHMLLEPLLALGNELSQLGFLLRRENLVRLRGYAGVLHFKLRVNLSSLSRDCGGLRLIESAALDELHHLLMALYFLLEQRL